jgi:uncharacterized linocin/CFP29 family protein
METMNVSVNVEENSPANLPERLVQAVSASGYVGVSMHYTLVVE